MTRISGKYDSDRDEILDVIARDGWANQSSGDVECPAGWFALVTIAENEVEEIARAHAEEIASITEADDGEPEFDPADLVGNFIMRGDDHGFVSVEEYPTPDAAQRAYDALDREYGDWLGDDD